MVKTILIIDDCDDFRSIVASLLLDAGYDIWEAACPEDALPILSREKFDLIICDLHMPFASGDRQDDFVVSYEVGVKTVNELRYVYPDVPIIALSNTAESDLQRISTYLDPVPAYTKPIHNDEILSLVKRSLDEKVTRVVQ